MCSSKMKEHLIIDGHNAIHAVPDLAKEMKSRNLARDSLLHLLEPLQIKEGCLLMLFLMEEMARRQFPCTGGILIIQLFILLLLRGRTA